MSCGCLTVGPNELLVVSGCCHSTPAIINGGRICVWGIGQVVQRLSLGIMTLKVDTPEVISFEGVSVTVNGVCQIKIDDKHPHIRIKAIRHFMNKTPAQITSQIASTLEGHQRAIMGTMTVEEIYQDRTQFAQRVYEIAKVDLGEMGLDIVSYTLTDISDSNGYLISLGVKRTSEVKRDARMGAAQAEAQAIVKSAECDKLKLGKQFTCDTEIAQAERDFQLRKIDLDKGINTKRAESEMEYNLRLAIVNQKLKEENGTLKIAERKKMIEVEEQEVFRREKELQVLIHLPAEAEKTKLEVEAEANKTEVILKSEAKMVSIREIAEAESEAIKNKGLADADQMRLKAEALQKYGRAAVADMVFQTLPKVAAEVATPMCNTKKMTLVSSDDAEMGASQITGEVIDIIQQMPGLCYKLTGVDINATVRESMK